MYDVYKYILLYIFIAFILCQHLQKKCIRTSMLLRIFGGEGLCMLYVLCVRTSMIYLCYKEVLYEYCWNVIKFYLLCFRELFIQKICNFILY